ncbi:MAG: hypothetical protein JWM57_1911 [Phycisphaerales bacterium]|nr:hypothetical protein [Phycisphaerales bacterium]
MIIRRQQRAFTLIEMVTSMAILAILMLACGSIVKMATNAAGSSAVRNASQTQSADAASRMVDDLNVATNFTQRTANAVTFTVPDRLNTGSPQSVAYSWSGIAGAPLLRTFNGGTATAILPAVNSLNFDYQTRLMGPVPGPAEQTVASHATVNGSLANFSLSDKNWASQYFTPSLPFGTSSYSITHIRVLLKAGAQDAVMNVSLRLPDLAMKPTASIVAQQTVYVSSFSTAYEWIDIPVTATGLNPYQPLCIVFSYLSGSTSLGSIQTDASLLSILSSAAWSTSSNAGVSWSGAVNTTSSRYAVFATVP